MSDEYKTFSASLVFRIWNFMTHYISSTICSFCFIWNAMLSSFQYWLRPQLSRSQTYNIFLSWNLYCVIWLILVNKNSKHCFWEVSARSSLTGRGIWDLAPVPLEASKDFRHVLSMSHVSDSALRKSPKIAWGVRKVYHKVPRRHELRKILATVFHRFCEPWFLG